MNSKGRYVRAAVVGPLVALMLQLGVVVPLLESPEALGPTAVESEHGSEHCPTPHDHTVCTQAGSNPAIAVPAAGAPLGSPSGDLFGPVGTDRLPHGLYGLGAPARAPPSA
jgi:hypothetical protein